MSDSRGADELLLGDDGKASVRMSRGAVALNDKGESFGSSLCFYLAGKHGVMRGLLYFGTFAELCNALLWVFVFRGIFKAHSY
jgi:hypothetical protein